MRAFDSNNHLQNNSLGQRFSSTDLAQVKSHYNEICYFINKKASRSKPFARCTLNHLPRCTLNHLPRCTLTGGVTPLRRQEGVYALCNARTRNDLWAYLLVTKLQMRCHDV